jgi:hypothetical protein
LSRPAASAQDPPIGADDGPAGRRSRWVQIWNSGAVWQTAISWLAQKGWGLAADYDWMFDGDPLANGVAINQSALHKSAG